MTSKDCRTNAYVCAKQLCECAEGYKHDEKNKTCIGGEYQFNLFLLPLFSYLALYILLLIFIFSCFFYALCFYSKLLYIFNSTRYIFTVINNLKLYKKMEQKIRGLRNIKQ